MKSIKPVEQHPAARLELAEALDWYEWHQAGLGARFLEELQKAEQFSRVIRRLVCLTNGERGSGDCTSFPTT